MKTLKINKLILLFIGLVVFNACIEDDDFDTPNTAISEPVLDAPVITIDALISLYEQEFLSYIDDLGLDPNNFFDQETIAELREEFTISLENTDNFVSGYVISNDEAGNFFEELIIQNRADQGSLGLRVMIDVNPLFIRYQFGQLVYAKLVGMHLGVSNGVLTLGITEELEKIPSFSEEDFLKRSPQIEDIIPTQVTIAEFNDSLENVFIQLNDVQFKRNDVIGNDIKTYAGEPEDEFDGERALQSCDDGSSVILSTSTFADFKSLALPSGKGSIKGILTRNFFGDTFNLAINTPEDLNLDNDRCDLCSGSSGGGNVFYSEDFEAFSGYTAEGWTNINVSGTSTDWFIDDFAGNNYSRISAFSSGNDEANVWLVTPAINMDTTTGEELSFDVQANFDNGTNLSLFVSSNFTGDPSTATWTRVIEASIPNGPNNTFGDFESVGPINISCLEGNVHFGFFYEGSDPNATTRYHIDNIEITGNN